VVCEKTGVLFVKGEATSSLRKRHRARLLPSVQRSQKSAVAAKNFVSQTRDDEVRSGFWPQREELGNGKCLVPSTCPVSKDCQGSAGRATDTVVAVHEERAVVMLPSEAQKLGDLLSRCDLHVAVVIVEVLKFEDETVRFATLGEDKALRGRRSRILQRQDGIELALVLVGLRKAANRKAAREGGRERSGHDVSFHAFVIDQPVEALVQKGLFPSGDSLGCKARRLKAL
jgi:hypothetical protein